MAASGRYEQLIAKLHEHARLAKSLRMANSVLTGIGYIMYPMLLLMLGLFATGLLLRFIVVPAIGFVLCSVIRRAVNAPRPYEVLRITPLIPKSTKGESFPSRHAFCMFTIACSWFAWQPAVGAILLVMACLLAAIRVLGGVHFLRDVVFGAILAIAVCALGYFCIPWQWPL